MTSLKDNKYPLGLSHLENSFPLVMSTYQKTIILTSRREKLGKLSKLISILMMILRYYILEPNVHIKKEKILLPFLRNYYMSFHGLIRIFMVLILVLYNMLF